MSLRSVLGYLSGYEEKLGELKSSKLLPHPDLPHLDPFLFLSHHGPQVYPPQNEGLPFAPHPHCGFETVSFVLSGELEHQDSAGFCHRIAAGGMQWMTAGRGLVHSDLSSERFRAEGGELEILQLWVNLPATLKACEPRYVYADRDSYDLIEMDDGRVAVAVVSGRILGREGLVPSLAGVSMAWITLEPGGRLEFETEREAEILFYVVKGACVVNGHLTPERSLLQFARDGELLALQAVQDTSVLLGVGKSFHEPIVAKGPFVLNNEAEIEKAMADYQMGRFG